MNPPINRHGIGSGFEEEVPGVTAFGIFGATDTATGTTAWTINVDQSAKSGVLVAGDLVFFGEANGLFHVWTLRRARSFGHSMAPVCLMVAAPRHLP
jgi:hypothetical protein